jgi:hypothetical protein
LLYQLSYTGSAACIMTVTPKTWVAVKSRIIATKWRTTQAFAVKIARIRKLNGVRLLRDVDGAACPP